MTCQITVAVVHNLKFGGARRVMAEQIARLPFEVTEFCLGTADAVLDNAVVIPYTPRAPGIPSAQRPPYRYADLVRLFRAWSRLARRVELSKASVVLVHPCQFVQSPTALIWMSKPSVYFCHEPRRVDYEEQASSSRRARTRKLYGPLYAVERAADRRAVAHSRILLTNSSYTSGAIRRAYGREATVARLGVPDLFFEDIQPVDITHVLTVGALIPSKGHDLVVEAVAFSDVSLPVILVAPRHAPAEEDRLHQIAKHLGVTLHIRVGISDGDLRDAYKGALATLYLAQNEPYGLVSIEAQACGSPAIVSNNGGLPETVVDGITGWAVSRRAAAVGDRLAALLDDQVREKMSRAARLRSSMYRWDNVISDLAATIEQLTALGPDAP